MEGEPALGVLNNHCAHLAGNWSISEQNRWKIADCYATKRYICESVSNNVKSDVEKTQDANQKALKSFSFRNSTYEISDAEVRFFMMTQIRL
jgi:hypothetical protein